MGLTIKQIKESFPDECKTITPREIKRLRGILRKYDLYVRSLRARHYDQLTEEFFLIYARLTVDPDKINSRIRFLENLSRPDPLPGHDTGSPRSQNITPDEVERARDRCIIDLYSFEHLRRSAGRMSALCPFHSEKTASFIIYANNKFHCFGCQANGDAITFVQKMNNLSFPEAVKFLAR